MSTSLGVLTVNVVAQTSSFQKGMDKAERASAKFERQLKRDMQKVSREMASVSEAVENMGLSAFDIKLKELRANKNLTDEQREQLNLLEKQHKEKEQQIKVARAVKDITAQISEASKAVVNAGLSSIEIKIKELRASENLTSEQKKQLDVLEKQHKEKTQQLKASKDIEHATAQIAEMEKAFKNEGLSAFEIKIKELRASENLTSEQKKQLDVLEKQHRTKQRIARITKDIRTIVIGTVAAATALAAATVSYVNSANEMSRFSKIANTGIGKFQKWAIAAKSVGIENDKLADILKDVNDKMGDYMQTGGGALKDFFENIAPKVGVTADAFRDLSGADALQLYVDTLEKAGVNQQDMTFYMEALANGATALLPLLQNGGELIDEWGKVAEKAGVIMNDKTAKAAKELGIQLEDVRLMGQGVSNQFMSALLPTVNEAGLAFFEMEDGENAATEAGKKLGKAMVWLMKIAESVTTVFKVLGESIGAAMAMADETINHMSASFDEDTVRENEMFPALRKVRKWGSQYGLFEDPDEVKARVEKAATGAKRSLSEKIGDIANDWKKKVNGEIEKSAKLIKELDAAGTGTGGISSAHAKSVKRRAEAKKRQEGLQTLIKSGKVTDPKKVAKINTKLLDLRKKLTLNEKEYALWKAKSQGYSEKQLAEYRELLDLQEKQKKSRRAASGGRRRGSAKYAARTVGSKGIESALIDFLQTKGLSNKAVAAIMGQMATETGKFKWLTELGGASYFRKYDGRRDLGNTRAGDGARYKGRGLVHITGRANYREYGRQVGVDLVNNPTLAARPDIAIKVMDAYLKSKRWGATGYQHAERGDIYRLTRHINGGTNGLAMRKKYYQQYLKLLEKGAVGTKNLTALEREQWKEEQQASRDREKRAQELAKQVEKTQSDFASLNNSLATADEKRLSTLKNQLGVIKEMQKLKDQGGTNVAQSQIDEARKRAIAGAVDMKSAPNFTPQLDTGIFSEYVQVANQQAELQKWYDEKMALMNSQQMREQLSAQEHAAAMVEIERHMQEQKKMLAYAGQAAMMSAGEQMFGTLAGYAKSYAGENSTLYRTMFAMEKAFAIARAAVAIQQGLAMASAQPWPQNLAAMASVAAATGSIISTIASVAMPQGMAHDGIDRVPKDGTWFLQRGERVTTAQTSKKLDRTLAQVQQQQAQKAQQAPQPNQNIRIINAVDPEMMESYLGSDAGEKIIWNVLKKNPTRLRQALS